MRVRHPYSSHWHSLIRKTLCVTFQPISEKCITELKRSQKRAWKGHKKTEVFLNYMENNPNCFRKCIGRRKKVKIQSHRGYRLAKKDHDTERYLSLHTSSGLDSQTTAICLQEASNKLLLTTFCKY